VLLCLMALTLFRPWATVPPIAQGRVISDDTGKEVVIPEPFPGVITGGTYIGDLLGKTHAPDAILKVGGLRDRPRPGAQWGLPYRIYPQVVRNDALWDFPSDTETVLAKDEGGVYLFGGAFFDEFGLTSVNWGPAQYGDNDNVIVTMTRMLNRIVGHEDYADILIARYWRVLEDMSEELRLETIAEADRPRTINMVDAGWERVSAESWYDARLGLRGGSEGFEALGRESDVERILAMNPDVIILLVGDAAEFLRDPRWRGMDAVRNRRVYSKVLNNYTFDLDQHPLGLRWITEVAYPDRMRPRLRELVDGHYRESYGYRLSDTELDDILVVEANRNSVHYERFLKNPNVAAPRTRDESQGTAVSPRPPSIEVRTARRAVPTFER
jgi:iron complex transport system substrate-binding protein